MTTSIKVHLNKSRATKDGTYPLVFQLLHQRKKRVIHSPYQLLEECFDKRKGIVINNGKKGTPLANEINEYIANMLRDLHQTIEILKQQEKEFSVIDIVDLYKSNQNNSLFMVYFRKQISNLKEEGRIGTANAYQSTFNCLIRFMGKNEFMNFEEMNVRWLNHFINYLQKSGLKTNTVNFYIRILRAIYNRAWKENIPGTNSLSPFKKITMSNIKTVKRAIDRSSIQLISRAKLEDNAQLELARDLFLFSYHSRGMAFVDMAFLKSSNISDNAIYYYRSKTGQPLRIKIVEPLKLLIDKYKNDGEYILPILRTESNSLYTSYRSGLKRHNHYLKLLSNRLNLPVPLTSYVARHSWATIARKNGIPVSVISEGLGHSSENITYTYLAALDPSVLDAANERISLLCL
jgi:integrase